jgi:glycosyltransferase involved in cell wall biosynthesis
LRIALDSTYSLGGNLSGVGVYSRAILHGLPALHPEARYFFCYRPHRFFRSFRETLPPGCSRRLMLPGSIGARAGVFHGLNQRMDRRGARRTVSTFHDVFVLTSEYSTPDFRERFAALARSAAERSDLIIAVSAFTAGQVSGLLGGERSRLRVIHHGVYPPPAPPGSPRENLILFTGALQARKNIVRLVEAFEKTAPGWRLVLAGSLGYGAEEILARIESSPRRREIDLAGYVSREVLHSLYARASVFAFPSLDEGFGMPVLEAMAWGVPVLTSNRSALPEVAGDAALLVDPLDSDSIARGLQELTGNAALRSELILKGRERSRKFSWEAAVEKTWAVYRELM